MRWLYLLVFALYVAFWQLMLPLHAMVGVVVMTAYTTIEWRRDHPRDGVLRSFVASHALALAAFYDAALMPWVPKPIAVFLAFVVTALGFVVMYLLIWPIAVSDWVDAKRRASGRAS